MHCLHDNFSEKIDTVIIISNCKFNPQMILPSIAEKLTVFHNQQTCQNSSAPLATYRPHSFQITFFHFCPFLNLTRNSALCWSSVFQGTSLADFCQISWTYHPELFVKCHLAFFVESCLVLDLKAVKIRHQGEGIIKFN